MSLLKTSVDSSPITIPFKVRMEPSLVEGICDLARAMREKGNANNDISGLLFGKVEPGVRTIEALKTFPDTGSHSEFARRQRWETAYKTTADESKNDLILSQLEIVGWFSFRLGSGLLSSDLVFHKEHFPKTEDLALIVWRDAPSQMTVELYSKSENDEMTSDEYRWGSVRLSSDIRNMREGLELAMRVRLNDDSYLRTYGSDEPLSQFEVLKLRAEELSDRIFGFLTRRKDDDSLDEYPYEPRSRFESLKEKAGAFSDRLFGLLREKEEPFDEEAYNAEVQRVIQSRRPAGDSGPVPNFDRVTPTPEPKPFFNPSPDAPPAPLGLWPNSGSGFAAAPAPARIPEYIPDHVPERPAQTRPFHSDFNFPENKPPLALPPGTALELSPFSRSAQLARPMQNEISGLPMLLRPNAPPKTSPWPWTIGIFLVCSGLVFGFLALGGLQGENGRLAEIIHGLFPGVGLDLRVKNDDDRLRLTWNQRNHAVASASDATLQIFDGQLSREVHLDGRQVADGSVLYRPQTNDVTFRMVVRGDQGAETGSVRVLDGLSSRQQTLDLSSPVASSALRQPYDPSLPGESSAPALLQERGPSSTDPILVNRGPAAASSTTAPDPGSSPVSAFVPPDDSRSGRTTKPAAAAEKETDSPASSQVEGVNAGGVRINGWDAVPEVKPRTRRAAPSIARAAGTYIAPHPLVQVMPNVRSIPVGTLPTRTQVAVKVKVDTKGFVTDAQVTGSGVNSKVAAAAVSAAKQWLFDPAKQNGQYVNSEHTIVFVLPAR